MHRILVVDDAPAVGKALAIGLTSQELRVDVAATAEDAIRLALMEDYAVLVADLCLPDMNGIQLITRIKSKHPKIIPIVITAYSNEERSHEIEQNGIEHFLEKPFTLRQIRTLIEQALAQIKDHTQIDQSASGKSYSH